jgi:hypothetical protein
LPPTIAAALASETAYATNRKTKRSIATPRRDLRGRMMLVNWK